ncbi:protein SPMIP2 [Myotis yumanensis]|uniref:protein SPMIP2 n=1 Tax=Myotis yumanensis TaxID=159337 RepID=UPI0038D154CB
MSIAYREPISATVGKRMIFTGPDYKKDYLPRVQQHTSCAGELPLTLERSGDLGYLWRPASCGSIPAQYRRVYVGEVGWGIPECDFINKTRRESGFHIKHTESRRAVLDAISHRYQNPWQPKPSTMDVLGKFSRGQIAWNMGDYENTDQRNSRGATLVRQAKETLPAASRPPKLPMPLKKEEV